MTDVKEIVPSLVIFLKIDVILLVILYDTCIIIIIVSIWSESPVHIV